MKFFVQSKNRSKNNISLTLVSLFVGLVAASGCRGCIEDEVLDRIHEQREQDSNTQNNPNDGGGGGAGGQSGNNPGEPGETPFDGDPPTQSFDPPPPAEFGITDVIPAIGPLAGGNEVRIVGGQLTAETRLFFGTVEAEVRLDGSDLVAIAPPTTKEGPVDLKLTRTDKASVVKPSAYAYQNELEIQNVAPRRVSSAGGVIEVRGKGFFEPIAVAVGGEQVESVERIDHETLRVYLPAHRRGAQPLTVTTRLDSFQLDDAVEYVDLIEKIDVSPSTGGTAGGDDVSVQVTNLALDASLPHQGVKVFFDDVAATITSIDPETQTIHVVAPPGHGVVALRIESVDDAATFRNAYVYDDGTQPTAVGLEPTLGPTAGRNRVVIKGANLQQPGLSVTFGGVTATIVKAANDSMTVEVPAGGAAGGAVDVEVLDSTGAVVSTLTDAYTYVAAGTAHAATPNTGTSDGGSNVTITGSHLDRVSNVKLGGVDCEFTVDSDSQVTFMTPPHRPGLVDLEVSFGGYRQVLTDAFTYVPSVNLWDVWPQRGSIAGGTKVRLYGSNFDALSGDLKVLVGGVEATDVQVVGPNRIEFVSPPHATPEQAEVRVVDVATSKNLKAPKPFIYFNPVSPDGGTSGSAIAGAINVTVATTLGKPLKDAYVFVSTRDLAGMPLRTNAMGQVTYSSFDLSGPTTVSAYAPGYSMATVQSFDAENVTIILNEPVPPSPSQGGGGEAAFGIFRGKVTASGKYSEFGTFLSIDMAYVKTTTDGPGTFGYDPGPNSTVLGMGNDYEIFTRIGDQAIVAICGSYDNETAVFTPLLLGIKRHQFLTNKEVKTVDIDCNIPLDQVFSFKFINPTYRPTGPFGNSVSVYWNFGYDGYFASPVSGTGYGTVIAVPSQPRRLEPIADLKLVAVGGSDTGGRPPMSYTTKYFEHPMTTYTMPKLLDIATPVLPKPGEVIGEQVRFAYSGSVVPDFWWIRLSNEDNTLLYEILLPGTETDFFVPRQMIEHAIAHAENPGSMSDLLTLTILGGKTTSGRGINHWSYQNTSRSRLSAYSTTSWPVRLVKP